MYPPGLQLAAFLGGGTGPWKVDRIVPVAGESLPLVDRLEVHPAHPAIHNGASWMLRGVSGHLRYTERREKTLLDPVSPPLGREEARLAALIPISKSPDWWALTQDERRAIMEERSHHFANGMRYLPRIARRLYHSRDLGEPFDFLTWFEFAPEHAAAFDELLVLLRAQEEWRFVSREVEIRLSRSGAPATAGISS